MRSRHELLKKLEKTDKRFLFFLNVVSAIFIIIATSLTFFILKNFPITFNHLSVCFNKFLVEPEKVPTDTSIFSFSVFVTALALLVAIYSATEPLYKFRVAVATIPILKMAIPLTFILGVGTLIFDVLFAKEFKIIFFMSDQTYVQALFSFVFFVLVVTWTYYSYFKSSKYGRFNSERYFRNLYHIVLKGSETDLKFISHELLFSLPNLIKFSPQRSANLRKKKLPSVQEFAFHTLNLISDKRLCRHIVSNSPATAIVFFDEIKRTEKYHLPINSFVQNIVNEAISNKDSIIYHENSYASGLIRQMESFTSSIFSDYKLVERLSNYNRGPLDVNIKLDADQLKIYHKVFLVFCEDYFDQCNRRKAIILSYAFNRALDKVKYENSDFYQLQDVTKDYFNHDLYKKFRATGGFIRELIELMEQRLIDVPFRKRVERFRPDILDQLCEMVADMMRSSISIKDHTASWHIQYSALWTEFFSYTDEDSKIRSVLHFKFRRHIYDEIKSNVNYVSFTLVFYCLNIMGLKIQASPLPNYKNYKALHKVLLQWVHKNFLTIYKKYPKMVEDCFPARMGFDKKKNRLYVTYSSVFGKTPKKDYLQL